MKAILLTLLLASQAHAGIIMQRMTGEPMRWDGSPPAGEREYYNWQADVYLVDDLSGGLVWLRSGFRDHAWVVNASPMHTDDAMYLIGDNMQLTLHGDFTREPYKPYAGELQWWVPEHNPSNYVISLRAEGRLWGVKPGVIVPEPSARGLLTIGLSILLARRRSRSGRIIASSVSVIAIPDRL